MLSNTFLREIKEKIQYLSENIIRGSMTIDEYKINCGKIKAFEESMEIYKDLVNRTIKDEEFEDE